LNNFVLQLRLPNTKKIEKVMVYAGFSYASALGRAVKRIREEYPEKFVDVTRFDHGVTVIEVFFVDQLLARYVLCHAN